jgi:chromate transporter
MGCAEEVAVILLQLFGEFLRIGALAFGGGLSALPMVESAAVRHGWLTRADFPQAVAISQSAPGPYLIISAGIGYRVAGLFGAAVATIGVFFAPVAMVAILERQLSRWKDAPAFKAAVSGASSSAVGLLAATATRLTMTTHLAALSGVLAALVALILIWKKPNPLLVIIACGLLGLALPL